MPANALSVDIDSFRRAHAATTLEKDFTALKIALNIVDLWGFNDEDKSVVFDMTAEELEQCDTGTFSEALNFDRRTRISLVIGIYKALSTLFMQNEHRRQWIYSPNAAFGGYSPKAIMCSGAQMGLHDIRKYLDAARR